MSPRENPIYALNSSAPRHGMEDDQVLQVVQIMPQALALEAVARIRNEVTSLSRVKNESERSSVLKSCPANFSSRQSSPSNSQR